MANCLVPGTTDRTSEYLMADTFGFAIPAEENICGVAVTINRRSGAAPVTVIDGLVSLVVGGLVAGDSRADLVTIWPYTFSDKIYGSSGDLWGLPIPPTPAEVNDAGFGSLLSVSIHPYLTGGGADVDYMEMTVYTGNRPIWLPRPGGNLIRQLTPLGV